MATVTVCEQTITIPDGNPTPSPTPSGGGLFRVNITVDVETQSFIADKTFEETAAAHESGQLVQFVFTTPDNENFILYPSSYYPGEIYANSVAMVDQNANVVVHNFSLVFGEEEITASFDVFNLDKKSSGGGES